MSVAWTASQDRVRARGFLRSTPHRRPTAPAFVAAATVSSERVLLFKNAGQADLSRPRWRWPRCPARQRQPRRPGSPPRARRSGWPRRAPCRPCACGCGRPRPRRQLSRARGPLRMHPQSPCRSTSAVRRRVSPPKQGEGACLFRADGPISQTEMHIRVPAGVWGSDPLGSVSGNGPA